MKLVLFIFIATAIYAFALFRLVREMRLATSKEERRELQSIPLIVASTVFYLVAVIKTTQMTLAGFLPLL